jgi:hypothetical protein
MCLTSVGNPPTLGGGGCQVEQLAPPGLGLRGLSADTPFLGRVAMEFFGTSLRGFRFFAAVSQGLVVLLTGGT